MIIITLTLLLLAIAAYLGFTAIVFAVWLIEQFVIWILKHKHSRSLTPPPGPNYKAYSTPILRWLVWPPSYFRHSRSKMRLRIIETLVAPLPVFAMVLVFEAFAWMSGHTFPIFTCLVSHSVHSIAPETPSFRLTDYLNDMALPDTTESTIFTFKEPLSEEFKESLADPSNGWEKGMSLKYGESYRKAKYFPEDSDEMIDHAEYVTIYPETNMGAYTYAQF